MDQFSAVLFDRTEKVDDGPAIFNVVSKAVNHVVSLFSSQLWNKT